MEIGLCLLHPQNGLQVIIDDYLGDGADCEINPYAKAIHGIRNSDCEGKPLLNSHWKNLAVCAKNGMCVHNKGTEKRVLSRAFPLIQFPWLDTLTLSRRFVPEAPSHRLEDVVKYLNREEDLQRAIPTGKWHRACFDAAASLLCLETIYETIPQAKAYLDHEIWKLPKK